MLLARSSGKKSKRSLKEKEYVEKTRVLEDHGDFYSPTPLNQREMKSQSSLMIGPLLMEVSRQIVNSPSWNHRKYLPFTTSTLR